GAYRCSAIARFQTLILYDLRGGGSGAVQPLPRSPLFGGTGYPLGVPPSLPANADRVSRVILGTQKFQNIPGWGFGGGRSPPPNPHPGEGWGGARHRPPPP